MTNECTEQLADIRQMFPAGELLTVSQVARYLGVCRKTAEALMGGKTITRLRLAMKLTEAER